MTWFKYNNKITCWKFLLAKILVENSFFIANQPDVWLDITHIGWSFFENKDAEVQLTLSLNLKSFNLSF